jgi:hypothetical protein
MLKLPSIPAAIVTGGLVLPVCVWGVDFLESSFHSNLLVAVWALLTFFVPIMFSTADMKHLARQWRKEGIWRSASSFEGFTVFVVPAWIRMFVVFLSALTSFLILEAMGLFPWR